MGKFEGYLICSDLDGTLFRKDKTISNENKAAIRYFQKEGGIFTFITGRMPYYATRAYELVNPNGPVGCVNGGALYDYETQKYLWTQELSPEAAELVAVIDAQHPDVGIQMVGFDHTYFCKYNDTMVNFRKATNLPDLRCDYNHVPETIAKVLFGTEEDEKIRAIERTLRSHPKAENYGFIRSQHNLFEILPKGIGKGNAVAKLVELLGLDPEKTVAIGDYDNDISMFQAVKLGVAVANACPAALAAADHVTVSNEDHAIAKIIYQLDRGELL